MSAFSPKRRTFRFCQTNLAPPETVFPLLCPVREADWLDGWRFTMMYSDSGLAEKGCVFRTSSVDAKDTFWVITRYSREEHEIVFARYTPDSVVCLLEIVLEPAGAHRSKVHITYTYTAIAPEGNPWIDNLTEEDFLETMRFWEKAINHYLATGTTLKRHHTD